MSEHNEEKLGFSLDPIDPMVTLDLFRQWRSPRPGKSNPERMNNPFWEWMIKSKLDAYRANEQFNGPDSLEAGPCWCFERYGQSVTELADGRRILIGGEHEDYYDADFYIYNDVVVLNSDGSSDVWGYPREIFPPTDFHSATLVGDRIVMVGNLGYPENREPEMTPVLILNLKTLTVAKIQTSGISPGWIFEHTAILSEDGESIVIQNGRLDRGSQTKGLVGNIDDWRLCLKDWHWERLTERR